MCAKLRSHFFRESRLALLLAGFFISGCMGNSRGGSNGWGGQDRQETHFVSAGDLALKIEDIWLDSAVQDFPLTVESKSTSEVLRYMRMVIVETMGGLDAFDSGRSLIVGHEVDSAEGSEFHQKFFLSKCKNFVIGQWEEFEFTITVRPGPDREMAAVAERLLRDVRNGTSVISPDAGQSSDVEALIHALSDTDREKIRKTWAVTVSVEGWYTTSGRPTSYPNSLERRQTDKWNRFEDRFFGRLQRAIRDSGL